MQKNRKEKKNIEKIKCKVKNAFRKEKENEIKNQDCRSATIKEKFLFELVRLFKPTKREFLKGKIGGIKLFLIYDTPHWCREISSENIIEGNVLIGLWSEGS